MKKSRHGLLCMASCCLCNSSLDLFDVGLQECLRLLYLKFFARSGGTFCHFGLMTTVSKITMLCEQEIQPWGFRPVHVHYDNDEDYARR